MFFGKLQNPTNMTWAKGQASSAELFSAGVDSLLFVENSNAADAALQEAYERRIKSIQDATGVRLQNPLFLTQEQTAQPPPGQFLDDPLGQYAARSGQLRQSFEADLRALAERFPELADIIRPEQSVEDDALALAATSDEAFARTLASRDDLWKWIPAFGGAALASLNDPAQVMALFAGGGAGGARTIGGRILRTAFSEMLVNGGAEALMQPAVQAWREKAGLPSGFEEAMANVVFAASFGALLGGGGRAVVEGFGAMGTRLPERTVAALDGDLDALIEAMEEISEALPDEARGALAALEREKLVSAQKPDPMELEYYDHIVMQTELALAEARAIPEFLPDEQSVVTLSNRIAPPPDPQFDPIVAGRDLDELIADLRQRPQDISVLRPAYRFLRGKIDPDSNLAADLRSAGITSKSFPGLYKRVDAALDGEGNRIVGETDNIPAVEARYEFPGIDGMADDGNGYVPVQIWFDALVDEFNGRPWLSANEVASRQEVELFDNRLAYLKQEGVDLSADPDTIKRQLQVVADREQAVLDGDLDFKLPEQEGERADMDGVLPGLAANQYVTELVRDLYARAGPGVDMDIIERAALDVLHNLEEVQAALDRAVGVDVSDIIDPKLPDTRFGDRMPEPDGVDDPGARPDWMTDIDEVDYAGFGDDDLVPMGEGAGSVADLKADIETAEKLQTIVEACRT